MDKISENKWIQLLVTIIITIIVATLVFPLLDYIYSLITHNSFVYSFNKHILEPIIFGIIFGLLSWWFDIRKKKNDTNNS